jgi:alpha-L-fucosidase 2
LEAFYYSHSYMIASASRGTKFAVGLWGPWVHQDSMYCAGCDFTMDYNYQAVYWGLYATNRLAQTQSQPAAILAYSPNARARAAHFNCSGLHYAGDMGPLGFVGLKGDGDMAIHSNGLLTALNFIQQWEYGRDRQFLRSVAFPFARDVLAFYLCWMTRTTTTGGAVTWTNTKDQGHECLTPLPQTEEARERLCYQNNSVLANGLLRRVASALPAMARADGQHVDPVWLEVTRTLVSPPTALTTASGRRVWVLAGTYAGEAADWGEPPPPPGWCTVNDAQNCGTRTCPPCEALPPGAQNIPAWQIWPAEAVNLASDADTLSIAVATLATMASWEQGNSFCGVFSQAARVGLPLAQWLPQLRGALQAHSMGNGVVNMNAGGAEVVGVTQALADVMLQSVTPPDGIGISWAVLFPIVKDLTTMRFAKLRAKGAFVVSAGWDAAAQSLTGGAAEVLSEVGERFRLWLPWRRLNTSSVHVTDDATGANVSLTFDARGRLSFDTKAGGGYRIILSS